MEPDLAILRPENIRLMTFEDHTLKVLLVGNSEVVFEFRNREEMDKAVAAWAKRSGVIEKLPDRAPVRFPPESRHQIDLSGF